MNIYLPDKNPVQVLATDGELKGETDCYKLSVSPLIINLSCK